MTNREIHFGRSFNDTRLEDACPCPKAACGLVAEPAEGCEEHNVLFGKTMRQLHRAEDCPGTQKSSPHRAA